MLYSGAEDALRAFVEATGIPVATTQAGGGSLAWDHPQYLGGIGATGIDRGQPTRAEADVIIGIGTRYSDFTTASRDSLPGPGRALRQRQRRLVRRLQARHASCRSSRMPGRRSTRSRAAAGRPARLRASTPPASPREARDLGRRSSMPRSPRRAPTCPASPRSSVPCSRRLRPDGRRRAGRGIAAGRPAQAVARARPARLPRRVRVLVHGLRDRRRASGVRRAAPRTRRDRRWSATARTSCCTPSS